MEEQAARNNMDMEAAMAAQKQRTALMEQSMRLQAKSQEHALNLSQQKEMGEQRVKQANAGGKEK